MLYIKEINNLIDCPDLETEVVFVQMVLNGRLLVEHLLLTEQAAVGRLRLQVQASHLLTALRGGGG